MVLDYPFVWPLWNAAENSQRQVCKQSLILSESTRAMDCARRRIRHKRHYGQRIDTTSPPQTFLRATSSILTYKLRGAKRWNNGNRVLITMSLQIRWANRLPIHPQPAFLTVNSPS